MYVYAQKQDKRGQYEMFLDTNLPEIVSTHRHIAIYQQSEQHVEGLDYNKVKLKGDLVLDIDSKEISESIAYLHKLLKFLQGEGLNLDYVKLYASGKKGFHIIIPQRVVESNPRPTAMLNKFHGWMVAEMSERCGVPLDMNLYHNRSLIRTPNLERRDGGYKVPISLEEAWNITHLSYREMCSSPRQLAVAQMVPNTYICEKLGALYTKAKVAVKEQSALQSKFPTSGAEELDALDKVPACIQQMAANKGVKTTANWNLKAMNVAAFLALASRVSDEDKEKTRKDFIEKTESDSRRTTGEKQKDLAMKMKAAAAGSLVFSCGACRSVLEQSPCKDCPMEKAREDAAQEITSIESRSDGYYVIGAKGQGTRITTFTLAKQSRVMSSEDGEDVYHADVFLVTQLTAGIMSTTQVTIPAEAWTSVASFKKAMAAVANCVVTISSEAILSALQIYLNETQVVDPTMKTDKCGIHIIPATYDTEELRTWVEPGWAVLPSGLTGLMLYSGNAGHTIQSTRGVAPVHSFDDEALEIFEKLIHSNRPDKVGQMLGWAAACHLKEHLYNAGFSEFPLLHIAGKPGAGKTQSAIVYGGLTGALAEGPLTVDASTPSPLRQALSQTTTIARVFDEFNRVNMNQTRYLAVLGYLKSAYCRQNVAQGILTAKKLGESTAGTLNNYATAPVIYMSREATESEELRQRSIIIQVRSEDHGMAGHQDNFQAVQYSMTSNALEGNPIQRWCKLLIRDALNTDVETVKKWYIEAKEELQIIDHARRVNNLACIMTGFTFLKKVLDDLMPRLNTELQGLIDATREKWQEEDKSEVKRTKDWTTSETLMKTIETMAKLAKDERAVGRILPQIHYIRAGNKLYINPFLIFGQYRAYCHAAQMIPECQSPESMTYMLKHTDYFLAHGGTAEDPQTMDWITLDISMLERRGIYGGSFTEQ